ncbi:MAG: tyrosine--tRNA ligase [bacterium]|nr:tyrosine--tRNA ligase [bacterium]
MTTIQEVLTRQVAQVLPLKEGLEALMKKRKVRVYIGIDPTGGRLHLGHTIGLRKLQQFADLGHEAILVVGTGTVLAGDPSQREHARPSITMKEIEENMKTWKKQASKIIDFSKVKMRYNGDWLLKLTLKDILGIASHVSASQLFQRDMFQRRLAKGDTVWTHELLYPLLQGYDSVALDTDVEIGGTDQVFNMLMGRELQQKMKGREKFVLTIPMIVGLDGKQMSKTSGNTVNIEDPPEDMYGKIMSLRDELMISYFDLCTDVPMDEVKKLEQDLASQKISPRDLKMRLAREIVSKYHSEKKAQEAEQEFQHVFQRKELPTDIVEVSLGAKELSLVDALVEANLASSKGEARRVIEQGGVKVAGIVEKDPNSRVSAGKGIVLQVGKRNFVKLN